MYAYTASGKRVFNTGKVLIGIRHEPPSHDQGISADRVQLALLLRARQTPRVRAWGKPWWWDVADFVYRLWRRT